VGGDAVSEETFGKVTVSRRPDITVGSLIASRKGLATEEIHQASLRSLTALVRDSVKAFRPDVIHFHNAHHFAPELALAFFDVARDIPLVNGVHDRVGEHIYTQILELGWAHIIHASQYLMESFPEGDAPKTALWLGIDLAQFAPEGRRDARLDALERPVVFHPARLLEWKGVEVGLDAFIEMRKRLGKGSLVLCASKKIVDDPEGVKRLRARLESTARNAGVEDHVHFLEFERVKIDEAYRSSDLIWYPTIDEEPLGLVPLEAMACGIPLVVSDSGGMKETVVHGETGLIVPKRDARALAEAACTLLTDRELSARCVEAGKQRSDQFDIQAYATTVERIYAARFESRAARARSA
jgi:glycosyltransferase involved in cell wall biosynthesis